MKVQDLTGVQLDWAVAKAEGDLYPRGDVMVLEGKLFSIEPGEYEIPDIWCKYNPTDSWHLAGPIIEREGINLSVDYQDDALSDDMVQIGWKGNLWNDSVPGTAGFLQWAYGPTPLIAAMRAYVMAKLGDEINIPEELAP